MFQADESSKIGYLKDEITFLLRKFMGKVVKARIIQSAEDLTAVSFKNCQLQDNIISVGVTSRANMLDHADEIQPSSLSRFFLSVRKFYEAVTSKMLAKFPSQRRPAIIYTHRPCKKISFLNTPGPVGSARGGVPEHPTKLLTLTFPASLRALDLMSFGEKYSQ